MTLRTRDRAPFAAVVLGLLAACGTTAGARRTEAAAPTRADADALFASGRYAEAAGAYERLSAEHPRDADLAFHEALARLQLSNQERNPDRAQALRARARALALRARELGAGDPFLRLIVDEIREDGTFVQAVKVFSLRPAAQAAIAEGEAAFAAGELDRALQAYQRALADDPRNYYVNLFVGDVHYARRDYPAAAEWFRKAIAIAPDLETAHRYLGDALVAQGKQDEALAEYVEAVLGDPYGTFARYRLLKYVQNVRGKPPLPGIPVLRTWDEAAAPALFREEPMRTYAVALRSGRDASPERRRTLAVELAALEKLAGVEIADPAWRSRLAQLADLRDRGLLAAHALLDRSDEELEQDYPAYRAAHRDELRRYVRRYWCGVE